MRALSMALALICAGGCASGKDGGQSSASNGAGTAPVTVSAFTPATADSAEAGAAKAGVTGSDAATLKRLGGTYLCDQRIYPRGGGAHITAWEWAFPIEPAELANALARELPGSTREELSFGFKNEAGKPDVVVSVGGAEKSKLDCAAAPSGSKSLVLASRM